MKCVIQRVAKASVSIEGEERGNCEKGMLILAAFNDLDDQRTVARMAAKIVSLRIFADNDGKMNLDIRQVSGSVLSVSQFTLYADCRKGNRPSFTKAGDPSHAKAMYHIFNEELRKRGLQVKEGIFGKDMSVELVNDGPVTIILDGDELFRM